MGLAIKTNKQIDLDKVKEIAFNAPERLLESLDINYSIYGDIYYSTCPIHANSDNNRAFSFSVKSKTWKCWTRNCEHSYNRDIFGLVRGVHYAKYNKEISFMDSVKYVCKIYNIDTKKHLKIKEDHFEEDDFSHIIKIFNHKLIKKEDAKVDSIKIADTSEYFINRGFREETLKYFGVGDCLEKQSYMKDRAIIPIYNIENDVVGYMGRAIKDYIKPKFLFSKGFNKTNYLYNYNKAIDSIRDTSCVFIAEGQGDVWRLYECGVRNCVGIFGKEISEVQKELLIQSGATTLIILTDNDQAGRYSKFQIQRQLSRFFTLKFPDLNKKDIGDSSISYIKDNILINLKGLF